MEFDTFCPVGPRGSSRPSPTSSRRAWTASPSAPEALPHPTFADVFTLGQCITEAYPSDWSGPETLRSVVVLFHGSFEALADPAILASTGRGSSGKPSHMSCGTIWRAWPDEDALEGVDYAMEEAFQRS